MEKVIVIPQESGDFIGHSDGMVRFINERTVLVNVYPDNTRYREFSVSLRCSLYNAGLDIIELPYTAHLNKDEDDATGCYVNYLEIQNQFFLPTFKQRDDETALRVIESALSGSEVHCIDARELAPLGGVLNCITWNIIKS